jgi:threonine synthase
MIRIPVSVGELLDKLSILHIKKIKIQNSEKLQKIEKEFKLLNEISTQYLGVKDFMAEHSDHVGMFLETAHPGKFRDVVEAALGEKLVLPERLAAFLKGEKQVISMGKSFGEFKGFLESLD